MKSLFRSTSYAFIAQVVSLLVSVIMSFVVSRFMEVSSFGYYQLFLFYSTYSSIIQFGVSEGVYLENGGKEYLNLDWAELKQLFTNTMLVINCLLIIVSFVLIMLTDNHNKRIVIGFVCLYAIVNFIVSYFGFILQTVNRTEDYSKSIIAGKLITLILCVTFVMIRNYSFVWYCLFFTVGHAVSGLIVSLYCKEILFYKNGWSIILWKKKNTIIAGLILLLSGLVSSFILGINRIFIEHYLGIEVFARVSLALNLISFFILFAIQVGMVYFPHIMLLDKTERSRLFKRMDIYTTCIMPVIIMVYIPINIILPLWIPQYEESIHWMLLFIPYMIYEIRTQIMYNTYLKVLRRERTLFIVNVVSLIVCSVANYIFIRYIGNLEVVFIVICTVMVVKSIVLSRVIEKEFNANLTIKLIIEGIICNVGSYICYLEQDIKTIVIVAIIYSIVCIVYVLYTKRISREIAC